jgi:signal peptidase I
MVIQAVRAFYALRRSKKVFHSIERLYSRKAKALPLHAHDLVVTHLALLQQAILAKNPEKAKNHAHELRGVAALWMVRSRWERRRDLVSAIGIALLIAVVVRQMWFELYTIPTGSMRPTLKESDFLIVSKNEFGLNVPLTTAHFTFDPSLVQRGDIVVWTGENMDIPDSDIRYFYLFPGKKQFVKRLMGKPGDTLYFYGGKIYGIDSDGAEITNLNDSSWGKGLEHIPFIHLEGRVEVRVPDGSASPVATFYQMNQPIAEIKIHPLGWLEGEVLGEKEKGPLQYSDLWGMKNYAKARLLTKEQLVSLYPKMVTGFDEGLLYLELSHHQNVKDAKMESDGRKFRPTMGLSTSFLPLKQEHIDRIASHMTTCRFSVDQGKAHRIGMDGKDSSYSSFYPKLPGIPDGTYEIQDGTAYQVYVGGITKKLESDHPLYKGSPEQVQALYNLGIEFLTQYQPAKNNPFYPSRYAYFRSGDLYLLNAPIVLSDDSLLQSFHKREEEKKKLATSRKPYFPFEDAGAPYTAKGDLDIELIRKYGLKIPEKMYLMLGDNHAMSADSREFGFVPQDNIKGVVRFLFSPPGSRFGTLPQPSAKYFTFPQIFVWLSVIGCGSVY